MKKSWGIALFGGVFFVATAAWAAEITPGQGDLSINQGQGFQTINQAINGRVDANVGDSVMVGPNGSATVSYADGCQVNLQPGTVMTIAPLSPCASGSLAQIGDGVGGLSPAQIALLALLGGGAAAGIYFATTIKTPTSP